MQSELIAYIRDDHNAYARQKGKPCGCIIATMIDDKVCFGISMCHQSDKWDKETAKFTARNRAIMSLNPKYNYKMVEWKYPADENVKFHLRKMVERAVSYFKDKLIIYPKIEWI